MLEAFFDKDMPRWIDAGVAMVPGKGTPLIAFLDMRQMKLNGVDYGTLTTTKLSTIQNIEAICQLEAQVRSGMPPDEAVKVTHSVSYAETELVQAGHKIANVRISGGSRGPLEPLLEFYEDRGVRSRADHDAILKKYGIARTDVVLWNYDVYIDLAPASGGAKP